MDPTIYDYKTPPMSHQLEALNNSTNHRAYAFFMEMGTGKTKVVIDEVAMMFDEGLVSRLLVVCPNGIKQTWVNELETHLNDRVQSKVHVYRAGSGKGEKAQMEAVISPATEAELHVLIMNVEAFSHKSGCEVAERFVSIRHVYMAVDESTAIKSPSASRTKNIIKIGKKARIRRIMTGSPVTRSPLDLYTQFEFLDPNILGYRSFYAFRNRYAVLKEMDMGPRRKFKIVVGYKNTDQLADLIKDNSFRVKIDDCIDLPEKVYIEREVPFTPQQKEYYKNMVSYAFIELDGAGVSATSVITQLVKLHQICCGHVTTEEGVSIDIPNNRMDALMSCLEETQDKVIIFATYVKDIQRCLYFISKEYGEESVASYYGGTNQSERGGIVEQFQDPDSKLRFLVANPTTGGYGLTLTTSATVIYYSNSYNLEHRIQSEARIHRKGQTRTVTYIDLVSPGTVDKRILQALKNKIDVAAAIMKDGPKKWLL